MKRRAALKTAGTALTTLTVGIAGCTEEVPEGTPTEGQGTTAGGTETTGGGTGTATGTDQGTTSEISMVSEGSNYYFDPIGLFVEPGTEVTWVNESGSHSSTAYHESIDAADVTRIPSDAAPWNSEIISDQGAEFSHTFEVQGTYDYFCIPHKTLGMVGRLVVGKPGDVEGNPPDGEVPSEETIVEQGAVGWEEFSG